MAGNSAAQTRRIHADGRMLKKVVQADLNRSAATMIEDEARIASLAGSNPDPIVHLIADAYASESRVNALVDYLMARIGREAVQENFRELMISAARDYTSYQLAQTRLNAPTPESDETYDANKETRILQTMEEIVNKIIARVFPQDYDEVTPRYYQAVFTLGKEMNIHPAEVFASDDTYHELLRRVFTKDEYLRHFAQNPAMQQVPTTVLQATVTVLVNGLCDDTRLQSEVSKKFQRFLENNPDANAEEIATRLLIDLMIAQANSEGEETERLETQTTELFRLARLSASETLEDKRVFFQQVRRFAINHGGDLLQIAGDCKQMAGILGRITQVITQLLENVNAGANTQTQLYQEKADRIWPS